MHDDLFPCFQGVVGSQEALPAVHCTLPLSFSTFSSKRPPAI
jgi:hypothetical protein